MKSMIFLLIFVLALASLAGWERTYGGSYDDFGYYAAQTSDGGYIVAGITDTYGEGTFYYDVYLIKTDAEGDTNWTRTYGGSDEDYGCSVAQTTCTAPQKSSVVLCSDMINISSFVLIWC